MCRSTARLTPITYDHSLDGREVRSMQSKATDVITIRTTVTQTIRIERTTEESESTAMPLIIVVLKDRKG